MKQRMEESPLDPYQCSESERIKQWRENLHNSCLEKKAQKAVLGVTPPSSDTISNDPDKDLAITDIGKTSVAIELLKKIQTDLKARILSLVIMLILQSYRRIVMKSQL